MESTKQRSGATLRLLLLAGAVGGLGGCSGTQRSDASLTSSSLEECSITIEQARRRYLARLENDVLPPPGECSAAYTDGTDPAQNCTPHGDDELPTDVRLQHPICNPDIPEASENGCDDPSQAQLDADSAAKQKLNDFDASFFADVLVHNSQLYWCQSQIDAMPIEDGQPLALASAGLDTDALHTQADDVFEPAPACKGEKENCRAVVRAYYGSWATVPTDGPKGDGTIYNGGSNANGCQIYRKDFDSRVVSSNYGNLAAQSKGGYRSPGGVFDANTTDVCSRETGSFNVQAEMRWKPYVQFVPKWIWGKFTQDTTPKAGPPGSPQKGWIINTTNMPWYVHDDGTGPVKRVANCFDKVLDAQIRGGYRIMVKLTSTPEMRTQYGVKLDVRDAGANSNHVAFYGVNDYIARVKADLTCFGPGTLPGGKEGSFTVVKSEQTESYTFQMLPECNDTAGWNAGANAAANVGFDAKGGNGGGQLGFNGAVHETEMCKRNTQNSFYATPGCRLLNTFVNDLITEDIQFNDQQPEEKHFFLKGNLNTSGVLDWQRLGFYMQSVKSEAKSVPARPGKSFGEPQQAYAHIKAGLLEVDEKKEKPSDRVSNFVMRFVGSSCGLVINGFGRGENSCVVAGSGDWHYGFPRAGAVPADPGTVLIPR